MLHSWSLSFGVVCISLLVFGSVAALAVSYWRDSGRRRRVNYVPIGEGQPANQVYPIYPQYSFSLFSSIANTLSGADRKNCSEVDGVREDVERERKVGRGGIDEESKGEREGESREVLSIKEMGVRANKSSPSAIQMTAHAYQQ